MPPPPIASKDKQEKKEKFLKKQKDKISISPFQYGLSRANTHRILFVCMFACILGLLSSIFMLSIGHRAFIFYQPFLILLESRFANAMPAMIVVCGALSIYTFSVGSMSCWTLTFVNFAWQYTFKIKLTFLVFRVFLAVSGLCVFSSMILVAACVSEIGGLKDGFIKSLRLYKVDPDVRVVFDRMQFGLECCGNEDYKDWFYHPWYPTHFRSPASTRMQTILNLSRVLYMQDTPHSCCDINQLRPCVHKNIFKNYFHAGYNYESSISIYKIGCDVIFKDRYLRFIRTSVTIPFAIALAAILICLPLSIAVSYSKNFVMTEDEFWAAKRAKMKDANVKYDKKTIGRFLGDDKVFSRSTVSTPSSASSEAEDKTAASSATEKTPLVTKKDSKEDLKKKGLTLSALLASSSTSSTSASSSASSTSSASVAKGSKPNISKNAAATSVASLAEKTNVSRNAAVENDKKILPVNIRPIAKDIKSVAKNIDKVKKPVANKSIKTLTTSKPLALTSKTMASSITSVTSLTETLPKVEQKRTRPRPQKIESSNKTKSMLPGEAKRSIERNKSKHNRDLEHNKETIITSKPIPCNLEISSLSEHKEAVAIDTFLNKNNNTVSKQNNNNLVDDPSVDISSSTKSNTQTPSSKLTTTTPVKRTKMGDESSLTSTSAVTTNLNTTVNTISDATKTTKTVDLSETTIESSSKKGENLTETPNLESSFQSSNWGKETDSIDTILTESSKDSKMSKDKSLSKQNLYDSNNNCAITQTSESIIDKNKKRKSQIKKPSNNSNLKKQVKLKKNSNKNNKNEDFIEKTNTINTVDSNKFKLNSDKTLNQSKTKAKSNAHTKKSDFVPKPIPEDRFQSTILSVPDNNSMVTNDASNTSVSIITLPSFTSKDSRKIDNESCYSQFSFTPMKTKAIRSKGLVNPPVYCLNETFFQTQNVERNDNKRGDNDDAKDERKKRQKLFERGAGDHKIGKKHSRINQSNQRNRQSPNKERTSYLDEYSYSFGSPLNPTEVPNGVHKRYRKSCQGSKQY